MCYNPSTKFLIYVSSKPKIDVCILLTPARALLLRFIYILRSSALFLYSLTSSSDQKSNDFRQNTSTMLGLFVFARDTNGKQNIGSEPSVTFVIFRSLSSAISICLRLLAHFDRIVNVIFFFCNLPYTKGLAKASAPQAAKNCSPEEAVILNPVFSIEKG